MTRFPPQDIRGFLACCAGEWLALRSRFAFDAADRSVAGAEATPAEEAPPAWHASDRGELLITYLEPQREGDPGGLAISSPSSGGAHPVVRRLIFTAGGRYRSSPGSAGGEGERGLPAEGTWELRTDGSLELTFGEGAVVVRERIWFTKPNLRLRSSVEQRADGRPGRARFSSEIRRVSPPRQPTPAPSA